ncbi:Alpha/Beta hydrolase protein [Panaeolus papilionaceus]|nr:Alpha/Beta hydrolase protein [Panaeolus papilionaceus]
MLACFPTRSRRATRRLSYLKAQFKETAKKYTFIMNDDHQVKTLVYKHVSELQLSVDVHFSLTALLKVQGHADRAVPAVVFFHPGGLSVGSKESWIPEWLLEPLIAEGYLFIIPEYQLMPPATGHEILHDIQDFFIFLPHLKLSVGTQFVQVDCHRVAMVGSSAGGLCCYLATSDKVPARPKAILSLYGMGGDFFLPHYLKPKTEVFSRDYELLEPAIYSKYLYPFKEGPLSPIVHCPPIYHPTSHPITPGYPADPRMKLPQLYLQLGVYHDYYTDQHEPSISAQLCAGLAGELQQSNPDLTAQRAREILPVHHQILFPQLNVTSRTWPPTLLIHGTADTAVPILESRNLQRILKAENVEAHLIEVDGQEHSFDFRPNAQTKFKGIFDQAIVFLKEHMGN